MYQRATILRVVLLLALVLVLQACATAGPIAVAREQFRHGDADAALQTLAEADISKRDKLLLYLDRGIIAQAAGRYQESVNALLRAAEIVDEQDYISISEQSAAIVVNDWARTYPGEYSEQLWIHSFQMINFLMLGDATAAAVEARRAVTVMSRFKKVLSPDVFTRTLMGMSFEAAGQRDSASVEYRKLNQDFDNFDLQPLSGDNGELTIIVAGGLIPKKHPGDLYLGEGLTVSFPFYPELSSGDTQLHVSVNRAYSSAVTQAVDSENNLRDAAVSTNPTRLKPQEITVRLADISKRALEARSTSIGMRQALRVAAKKSLGDAIYDENEVLGIIAQVLFFASERADTRGWDTLPATVKLIRIPLAPGQHDIAIEVDASGFDLAGAERFQFNDVEIRPRQRSFRLIRLGLTTPFGYTPQN